MGVKNFISALLPRAYREQALGDLHERGFRLGDIVSVLPRVWWSHALRSCAVPNLAGATNTFIEGRARRLEAWRAGWVITWITVYATSTWLDVSRGEIIRWFWVIVALAILVAIGSRIFYLRAQKPEPAVRRHRSLLLQLQKSAQLGGPYLMLVAATGRFARTMWDLEAPRILEFAVIAGCFAYGQFRARRLQKEIESLA